MNPVQLHPSAQDEHGVMPPQSYYYFYGSGDSPLTTANRFGEHNTCPPTATPSTMAAIQRAPTSSFFFNDVPIEEHETDGFDQYPSLADFEAIVQGYLRNLSPKKRDKALVDRKRYSLIARVLKDPRNTSISTAQFRFWVKKMFQLVPGQNDLDIVCHDNKPVAMREQIYMILVRAHKEANHGGRDKTSALVRRRYSWIPKELIARFVRHCPFCMSRRNGCQSPPMGLLPRTPPEYLATAPVGDHHSNEQQAAMMAAPLTSTATGVEDNGLLFMNDESWHACFRSADSGQLPVNYTASPPPPPSAPERQPGPPAFIHQQQQHQFHDSEQQQQQQQSRPSLPGLGMTGYAQNEPITTTAAAATFEMCYRDFSQPPPQQQQFSAPLAQPQPIYVHTNRSIKTGDFRTKAIFPYDLSAPSPSSSFSSSSSFSTSASSVVSSPVTQTPTSMDQQHAIFPPTTQWYSISHTNNGALGPQQHPQQRFF